MIKVIGVRFRTAGKIYFFDPLNLDIKRGDHVIVETARGIEFGTVMTGVTEVEDGRVVQPLKPVIRLANARDVEQEANNKLKEREAFKICLEKIQKHGLEMKLIDAEYTFDNNKVLFYFTADGRIDFRELVKDLAGVFKTRIELRQIGVRDETKIVGGIGICGRPLCCHSYLADFVPVSIKMAKEQNLSLNPTKISGVCGRLMCCLKNEEETYEELNRKLPGIGDYVTTEDGLRGEVQSVNVLRQLVKVVVEEGDEKEIKEYPVEQLQFRRRHGKKEKVDLSREEMQELEKLEEEEQQETAEPSEQTEGTGRQNNRNRTRQNGQEEPRREYRSRQNGGQDGVRREYRNRQGDGQDGAPRREYRNRQNDGQDGAPRRDYRSRQSDGQDGAHREYRNRRNEGQGFEPRRDYRNRQGFEQRQERQNGEQRYEANAEAGQGGRNHYRNRHNRQRQENQEGQTRRNDNRSEGQ